MKQGISDNPLSYTLREVPIEQISVWDEAQARTLDTDGVSLLARSIEAEGLQNPPIVKRDGRESYLLMAGQRRLAALKMLGAQSVPVLVLARDESRDVVGAKTMSVIENLHRKDMTPKEVTESCKFLAEHMGESRAAKALGIKPATMREYLGFAAVPDRVKSLVPKVLSKRDAIRIYKVARTESATMDIVDRIEKYDSSKKKRYIDALESLGAGAGHAEINKLANSFRARQNLSVRMSKSQAKGLAKLSRQTEMEPAEFAQKIVADYLARRGIR